MKLYIDDKSKKLLPIKSTSSTYNSLDDTIILSIEFEYPVNFILYSKSPDNVYKMVGIVNNIKNIHVLDENMFRRNDIVEIIDIADHYGISCSYAFWKYEVTKDNDMIIYDH